MSMKLLFKKCRNSHRFAPQAAAETLLAFSNNDLSVASLDDQAGFFPAASTS
jgi:hypothetical protein